jgi:putative phosphoribosyl transferase
MFTDRRDAGIALAASLLPFKNESPLILALPRGGVLVAYEVAQALDAPLDIIVARKLGAPGQHELGVGAIVDGDHPESVLNEEIIRELDVSSDYIKGEIESELKEMGRREAAYRQGRPRAELKGRTVIVIDDGIATGGSIRAALRGVRRKAPGKVVLAVPVAPAETIAALGPEADEIVCLEAPDHFVAIGDFYDDFSQTSDEEVIALLEKAHQHHPPGSQALPHPR